MTVPFILALGMGVANARGSKNSKNDSFGLVSFCSVGPILMVLILCIFFIKTIPFASRMRQATAQYASF